MNTILSPKATEIVMCARTLLAAGGYHSFSYADISEAVHISKASIHHHFASKAELVRTVVAHYREEARVSMAALDQQNDDPVLRLQAYVRYWQTCIHDGSNPFCVCVLLAAELPAIPPEVSTEVKGHFLDLAAWLTIVLKDGVAKGRFQLHATAESEAMSLMATVHGSMLAARATDNPGVFDMIVQPVMHRLLAHV